jgi:hypothetical protein
MELLSVIRRWALRDQLSISEAATVPADGSRHAQHFVPSASTWLAFTMPPTKGCPMPPTKGCQAEIDAVSHHRGEQDRAVVGGFATALVREAFQEAGPGVHLQQ